MSDIILNEIPLKFTKNDFQQKDTPDLLMNVWTYNYYKPHCEKRVLHAKFIVIGAKKY